MIEIPVSDIPQASLIALIEAFVLREGTDYGEYEVSLASKVHSIEQQLHLGKLKILFDENEETCTILSTEQLLQFTGN